MLKYLTPKTVIVAATLVALLLPGPAPAQAAAEKRIALVIGNADYQTGTLKTPANDAGLIAQTLQAAGFDVGGARDLDQVSLRQALRDFLDKAQGSGPDTVAVIYLAGYGLQLEGENYFAPIDARIARDTDVSLETVRVSDYTRGLAALKLKASVIIIDTARAHPFAKAGHPLTGGLALVEAEPNTLIAFSAAPGTVAPESQGDYGPYAQALAEMMREGGMPIDDVFDRTRLRVNERPTARRCRGRPRKSRSRSCCSSARPMRRRRRCRRTRPRRCAPDRCAISARRMPMLPHSIATRSKVIRISWSPIRTT